jgi:predicted Fe-Mo cluster-binding NifX family protein
MEDEAEVGNVGSEHESAGSEYDTENGNCEDIEAETEDRNGEGRERGIASMHSVVKFTVNMATGLAYY